MQNNQRKKKMNYQNSFKKEEIDFVSLLNRLNNNQKVKKKMININSLIRLNIKVIKINNKTGIRIRSISDLLSNLIMNKKNNMNIKEVEINKEQMIQLI